MSCIQLLSLIVAYLLGSFPSAYLLSRLATKEELFSTGSGNIGGMNVLRNVSRKAGLVTIILDIAKGATAALIVRQTLGAQWGWLALPAAICGHNWMPWLGFRGGKGLSVGWGVLLVLNRPVAIWTVTLLLVFLLIFRNDDLAIMLLCLTFCLLLLLLECSFPALGAGVLGAFEMFIKALTHNVSLKHSAQK